MSIKGFDFNGVVHKYDYNALDNIPDLETDKTLTIDGAPADAKATGDRIANLQALVGSPLTASTAAGMTDNSKVYVYVGSETGYTNGNWYYYDGSAWVSGGVYNSVAVDIDTTLTLSNKAPDSKVVGDAISSLNEDITNIGTPPKVAETEENSAELYFADNNGNVLAKLSDGHIKLGNFDSSEMVDFALVDASASLTIVDQDGNAVAEFIGGHIKTKNFDSRVAAKPCEYMISGGDLYISYGYTDQYDAVVILNNGRANGLFDFSAFKLKTKGTPLNTASLINVWTSGSDMHSPFQFLAKENADGYFADATDAGYTGGNHTQTINDTAMQTASSAYVHFFADGKPVTSGYGGCSHFEIRWANNVQAYNCLKADGTGRTSLIEYHDMIFDGVKFDEKVTIIPQEDIKMEWWEAFATVAWGSTYTNLRYVDGENRGKFTYVSGQGTESGNAKTSGIILWGDNHGLEMTMDTSYDLGKRLFYEGTGGAYTSAQKAYFRVFRGTTSLDEGNAYYVRGSFRFFPVVA